MKTKDLLGIINDEIFTKDELDKIESISEYFIKERALLQDSNGNPIDKRVSNIRWLKRNPNTEWIYSKIYSFIEDINYNGGWNFEITNELMENIQITYYDSLENGHYDFHYDIGNGEPSFRKLSVSIQLSDEKEYEGGELELLVGQESYIAPKKRGTSIIFPSYIMHRVKPVSKGIRKSLVCWIIGEPFK